jgi:hypothetical protein
MTTPKQYLCDKLSCPKDTLAQRTVFFLCQGIWPIARPNPDPYYKGNNILDCRKEALGLLYPSRTKLKPVKGGFEIIINSDKFTGEDPEEDHDTKNMEVWTEMVRILFFETPKMNLLKGIYTFLKRKKPIPMYVGGLYKYNWPYNGLMQRNPEIEEICKDVTKKLGW